jgi:hypothetical protein
MVKKIFDSIDMDGSGMIDREELAAAIIRFDRNHDPEFLDRVLEEENLTEMEVDMTYPQFEEFLIGFLQHQFYECLEHFVTNKQLFLRLGGRAVTMSAKGDKIVHRKSMAMPSMSGSGGADGAMERDLEGGDLDRGGRAAAAAAKAAAKAKAEAIKKKGMDQVSALLEPSQSCWGGLMHTPMTCYFKPGRPLWLTLRAASCFPRRSTSLTCLASWLAPGLSRCLA